MKKLISTILLFVLIMTVAVSAVSAATVNTSGSKPYSLVTVDPYSGLTQAKKADISGKAKFTGVSTGPTIVTAINTSSIKVIKKLTITNPLGVYNVCIAYVCVF